jgi:hypothetical protein
MYAIKLFWSGCHAQFGSYGTQKGDGISKSSGKEQREIIVGLIMKRIGQG